MVFFVKFNYVVISGYSKEYCRSHDHSDDDAHLGAFDLSHCRDAVSECEPH